MPRHDPPEGGVSPYYVDPPMGAVSGNDLPSEIVVKSPKKGGGVGRPLQSPDQTEEELKDYSDPSNSGEKKHHNLMDGTPGRNDDDTPRKEETASDRDSEELPDSLMVTYTLSSQSGNGRPRRSSVLRGKDTGTPPKATATPSKAPGGSSRVVIENMPRTPPVTEVSIENEGNREGSSALPSKTPTTSNKNSTYLTRKAHKFSSLKKRRGTSTSNNMLQRLFYGSSASQEEEGVGRSVSVEQQDSLTIALADSDEKEESGWTKAKENQRGDELATDSGCQAFADMMDQAKDTFMLSAEADVRNSIQGAVNDALGVVLTSPNKSVKVQETEPSEEGNPEESEKVPEKEPSEEGNQEESSLTRIFDHWKRKSMSAPKPETGPETTPSWKIKAQAAAARRNTEEMKKISETETETKTPMSGAKSLFPSAIEYWEAVTSGKKTPTKAAPTFDIPTTKPPVDTPNAIETKSRSEGDKVEGSNPESDKEESDGLYPESVISAPSDEPKSPTTSPRAPVDDDDDAFLPDDFQAEDSNVQVQINKALVKARADWERKEMVSMRKRFQEQQKEEFRKKFEVEFTKEHEEKIKAIKATEKSKWDAMEKERKKTLVAVEKERQKKLDEIEQEMNKLLEIQKEHLERHTPKEELERKLHDLRMRMQYEKETEVKTLKQQYERKMTNQKEQINEVKNTLQMKESQIEDLAKKSSKLEEEITQARTELDNTKEKLEEKAKESDKLKEQTKALSEKLELLQELKLKSQDDQASDETTASESMAKKIETLNAEWEMKIDEVKREVETEKQQLAIREQALIAREEHIKAQEDATVAKQKEVAQTSSGDSGTPSRSSHRSVSRIQKPKSASKTPLRKFESLEVLEREKEGLQKQIKVLEAQAKEASQEHERTLKEFRSASEQEIDRLKKDMERRHEEHAAREQELTDSLAKVDSWEKEELKEKIEQLEWDKKNDKTGGQREVQKKEDLLQKISQLEKNEKKLLDDHETALRQLRESSELEVKDLRDEIERQQDLHFSREQELSLSLSHSSSFEKEDLQKKIDALTNELKNEKAVTRQMKQKLEEPDKGHLPSDDASPSERLKKSNEEAESKILELTTEIESLRDKVKELEKKEKDLENASNKMIELETELQDKALLLQKTEEELVQLKHHKENTVEFAVVDELKKEIEDLNRSHVEQIEDLKKEAEKSLKESKEEGDNRIKKLQEDHESILDSMKSIHKEYIASMKSEAESIQKSSSQEESNLRLKIEELEEQVKEQKDELQEQIAESEEKVRLVAAQHAQELDDLIKQLDLLETEQKAKFDKKETEIKVKEELISGLSEKLTESETKRKAAEEAASMINELAEEAKEAQSQVEKLTSQLESLQTAYEKHIAEAEEAKEAACEEAREEMIERAEIQFRQANDLYVKLKKQYDTSRSKVERLEKELKSCKRDFERVSLEKNDAEVNFRAELAESNAQSATIEAAAAQHAKDYRREMEGLLQAAKEFEEKADSAEALSRNVQKTLASLVVEKDKLERAHQALKDEHQEMKQVCEELMAELEGRQY